MKKKNSVKKLSLNKSTIAELSLVEYKQVKAGRLTFDAFPAGKLNAGQCTC
ncbi:MAG: hypothetical protein GY757_57425 [bacterium]|nr:hypothetical protein [bacterium]